MGTIFFAPLTGLVSAYNRISITANNIANLNTIGFHAYQATSMDLSPLGTALQSVQRSGQAGFFFQTGSPTDLAISGDAYFEVQTPDGKTAYTRAGSFSADNQGYLTTSSGARLQPSLKMPAGAQGVFVGQDGRVTAIVDGETQEVGRVQLARFNNPNGLQSIGENLFAETSASGEPSRGYPGDGAFAPLFSGYLESSNVDLPTEFVNLMTEKTAVAANVKAINAAQEMIDDTLQIGKNLPAG